MMGFYDPLNNNHGNEKPTFNLDLDPVRRGSFSSILI